MNTVLLRGSRPDKRSEMSESNSADDGDRLASVGPQRCEGNRHLRWVPGLAALLSPRSRAAR